MVEGSPSSTVHLSGSRSLRRATMAFSLTNSQDYPSGTVTHAGIPSSFPRLILATMHTTQAVQDTVSLEGEGTLDAAASIAWLSVVGLYKDRARDARRLRHPVPFPAHVQLVARQPYSLVAMYAFSVISLALLVGQAAASASLGRSSLAGLLKRQTAGFDPSDVPAQCQSDCATILNSLSSCPDVSCLCTDAINQGLHNCLECVLAIPGNDDIFAQAQSSLQEYQQACQQVGVNITPEPVTLPSGSSPTAGSSAADSDPTVTSPGSTPTSAGTGAGDTPNPLATGGGVSKNGAASVSASAASIAGIAGLAFALLAL
ncbi:hypothetical protein C8Q80DRAFT_1128697 [Daedaleopsis nitida]|nr:hypothetical protein C8Q80DRAFT_1128697 [Daedaleopsis nitida]